jgi:hypothetical protein
VDTAWNRVVVRCAAPEAALPGDLLEAMRAGRVVGRLRVVRLLPPDEGAPAGSVSCEPDRGGATDPFRQGDRVRSVVE